MAARGHTCHVITCGFEKEKPKIMNTIKGSDKVQLHIVADCTFTVEEFTAEVYMGKQLSNGRKSLQTITDEMKKIVIELNPDILIIDFLSVIAGMSIALELDIPFIINEPSTV